MLKVREAVEKEVKEKNLNEADAKKLLVTTIKVCIKILIVDVKLEYIMFKEIACDNY